MLSMRNPNICLISTSEYCTKIIVRIFKLVLYSEYSFLDLLFSKYCFQYYYSANAKQCKLRSNLYTWTSNCSKYWVCCHLDCRMTKRWCAAVRCECQKYYRMLQLCGYLYMMMSPQSQIHLGFFFYMFGEYKSNQEDMWAVTGKSVDCLRVPHSWAEIKVLMQAN
jgi:hypothetical protein